MDFLILGALELVNPRGTAIDLGGVRERTLLALLLLCPGQVVPAGRLAELLWDEQMPQGAAHALRVHISRLRRALRPADADQLLVTQAPGYLMRVNRDQVDAGRFESLLVQGRAELARGAHQEASRTLRSALALWRGPALAGLADTQAVRIEAARLEEARLEAVEERIEADLACGRHGELAGELEALTEAHQLRERLWSQRMLALYRGGRQAEALQVYRRVRELLDTELGIQPGARLSRLHGAILSQDPDLELLLPPAAARPVAATRPSAATRPRTPTMPPLLTEMGRVFVGRHGELARLDRLWQESAEGTPRLALVAGEPGVGKTRLAAEFAVTCHDSAALVLAGRCDEDLGVPFQPFVEALRDYVGHTDPAALRAGLGRFAGELVRLVPEIGQRVSDLPAPLRSDQETERYRLFDAVAAWLAVCAETRGVLLVLDDLHWAAKPTLQLLRHVTRSARSRLLVIGTYRDTELHRNHPLTELLADLRRQPGVHRVHLSGLDEIGVVTYLERTAGHDLSGGDLLLARAIHAETEGNPFFVREILRHLTETGQIQQRDGRWGAERRIVELGIPDGVREVVGRRLSRLSEETIGVLSVAAVVGAEFEFRLLGRACGQPEETVITALDEATGARLIIEVAGSTLRYRFAHAIVRATLQDELTGARRLLLHRRVATAIEELHAHALDDHLPALARHWARASVDPAERTRAVDYAARAGERAVAQLANDDAVTYYRQAVDLLPPAGDGRRIELLIALGEAQRRAGDAAHRQTLLAAAGLARTRGDAAGLARAAIANSPGSKPSIFGITDHERVASLEAALDAVGPADSAARARLLAILALELFHTPDRGRRLALSDDALAIARRMDDPQTLSHVLVARPFAIGGPDTLTRRLDDTAELLRVAQRLDDPVTVHRAWWSRFRVAVEVGDVDEADRCLAAEHQLIADIGQPTLEWMTGLQDVATALRRGRFPDAERLIPEVYAQGQLAGQQDARLYYAIQLFQLRYEQGRVGEAEAVLRDVVAASPELPAIRAALALLLAETGRIEEATALFDEVAGDDLADLPVEASTMVAFGFCAELCAVLGDLPRAEQLSGVLAPYPDQIAVWAVGLGIGSVAHFLGRLAQATGEHGRAVEYLLAAVADGERIGAPTWSARSRSELGRVLLARGEAADHERAVRLLEAAAAAACELGLGLVARRSRAPLDGLAERSG